MMDEANRVAQTVNPSLIAEPDEAAIARAVAALRCGQLVAFPTETVYGLGADARNDEAVAAIFEAKGRPAVNPLIVHVRDLETAQQYGQFDDLSVRLAENVWPGPLTLVVPVRKGAGLSGKITAGLETVALRVPGNAVALALLEAFDGPIAAPSANPSGKLSPTEAEHVEEGLGDRVSLILDGGPCQLGLESTIIGTAGKKLSLLRAGAIPVEEIERLAGSTVTRPCEGAADEAQPLAPGNLSSHYAPNARLRLDASNIREGEMMLAFGPDAPKKIIGVNLSPSGDLAEAAANLYAYLRILDDTGIDTIAVMPIPDEGLGRAINDRLKRAAAPRP